MTAGNSVFQLREGAGWSRGLDNLVRAELGRWFRTRKWWGQLLIWAGVINSILALIVVAEDSGGRPDRAMLLNVFLGIFATIGVCILMQGVIVGDKQSGTVAWVLSKPVSRAAFVLAKLVGNTAGIATTIVLAQGSIAYLLIFLGSGTALPPLGFLGGLGVQLVHLLFYVTLTLMLGTVCRRRGPVIAIPLVFLFVQQMLLGVFPALISVLPWNLAIEADGTGYPSIATALMTGTEPLSYMPVAATTVASALFLAIALWVFERLEF